VGQLSEAGRRTRAVAAAGIIGALLVGGFFGDDDHFPFGPMRMYSTTNEVDGPISSIHLEGTTVTGEILKIKINALGLRPAELDGQIPRFRADPSLMQHVLETYEERNPQAEELTSMRLVRGIHQLEDRREVGYSEEVIAEWTRD
jgi:hypothetical protein